MKVKALLMGLLIAGAGLVSAEEVTLEGLQKDYEGKMDELREKYQAAKTKEEKQEVLKDRPDPQDTVKAMMPLIKKQGDDPKVLKSVGWVIMQSRQGMPEGLIEIIEKHKESKDLSGILFLSQFDRSGELKKYLVWARENSKHPQVQGVAAFVNSQDRSLGDAEKLEELKFAIANLGDYEFRGVKLKERAEGSLFAAENIQIGKTAPEIVGEDQDGVEFKLSEYRGKVVVLDFWGDW